MLNVQRIQSNARLIRFALTAAYWSQYRLRDENDVSPAVLIEEHAAARPDDAAVLYEDQRYSWRELDEACNRVGGALTRQGGTRGDTVAIMLDNRPEFLFAAFGANKIGMVGALINTNLTGSQLVHAITIATPSFVIVGSEHAEAVAEVASELGLAPERILVWRESKTQTLDIKGALAFDQLYDEASAISQGLAAQNKGPDRCLLVYTSGTTGLPKAALLKNNRYLKAAYIFGKGVLGVTPKDVYYTAGLPLYHNSAFTIGVGAAIVGGATIALRRKFSASGFWDDVAKFDATLFVYIGEICRYLLSASDPSFRPNHRLRACVGAGLRPDIWDEFKDRFALPNIYEFYGASEGNVGLVNLDQIPGMVGRVLPGTLIVRVDAETEEPLRDAQGLLRITDDGEPGMLIGEISDRNSFDGYVDKSKNQSKILINPFGDDKNYFNSGDLVIRHAGGHVSFADRLGDTFRWKGENVATNDVSELLNGYDGIDEATVFGVEVPGCDGRAGMAAIVINNSFDPKAVATFVCAQLPAYARPLFLRVQSQLTKTGSFKYVKTHLKKDGFDLDSVSDTIYFLASDDGYVPLTPALLEDIRAGRIRL